MEIDYKEWCLKQAIGITKAYTSNDAAKGKLDDILESLYKKLKDLRTDASKKD